MKNVAWFKIGSLALSLVLCLSLLTACGGSGTPAATTAPKGDSGEVTAIPATGVVLDNEWPTDEAIAYCPQVEGVTPSKVSKQEGQQRNQYIITFDGIDQDQYDAYAKVLEEDPGITVLTNFSTRDTSYSLQAHKVDDKKIEVRITYTKPTQVMQVSVGF